MKISETHPEPGRDERSSRGGRIVILGATGYVGARLVPRLAARGDQVIAVSRSASDIEDWAWGDAVATHEADLTDPDQATVFEPGDTILYLVHSMTGGDEQFSEVDLTIAQNVAAAAARAGARRIVYLSGLGGADDSLSDHLESRQAVGDALRGATQDSPAPIDPTPVTELRAALLLGSGSASFEMLRTIAELSPILPVPRAVTTTRCQPISIEDALEDLEWAIDTNDNHPVLHIGGRDAMTYADIIRTYGRVSGLRHRRLLPIPLVPTALSAFVLNLFAPLPGSLVKHLVGSIGNDVVVDQAKSIDRVRPDRHPLSTAEAIERALRADADPESHWSDDLARSEPAALLPADQDWAGQRIEVDERTLRTEKSADEIWSSITAIGGRRGWLVAPLLWELRGVVDRLTPGGVGLRRGRRHPTRLRVGDVVDWWRVEAISAPEHLLLRAEMRTPGPGWLEWRIEDLGAEREVRQRAVFIPHGLAGRLYWLTLLPFHGFLFPRLLRRLVDESSATAVETADREAIRDPRQLSEA